MKNLKIIKIILLLILFASQKMFAENISLAGNWAFELDPSKLGIGAAWFSRNLADTAFLPGSLNAQGLSPENFGTDLNHLTKQFGYVGWAWYQTNIFVPETWDDKRIVLFLERAMWETKVFVDDTEIGTQNSLCVPHIYDLTDNISTGAHRITILVDNTVKINIGHSYGGNLWAHAISEETQTCWNGVIGRIELISTPKVWIDSVKTFPDLNNNFTLVKVTIGNASGGNVTGTINAVDLPDGGSVNNFPFSVSGAKTEVEIEVPFGASPRLWNEFSPELHEMQLTLSAQSVSGGKEWTETKTNKFGIRKFRAVNKKFEINDQITFLRGKVDSAVFPLTGYPPMTVSEWRRNFGILTNYGINHVRFHSWCPPEAVFTVADEFGMMLQVEPPIWDGYGELIDDPALTNFIAAEANRIVDVYGNHPSFCLMSMGNELGDGSDPFLNEIVDQLQIKDDRHVYTSTTHPANINRIDDYFVAAATTLGPARGAWPFYDFSNRLSVIDRPFISHELGQPAMYPDYNEISKYIGHLKPKHLEVFRQRLDDNHMLDLAEDFRLASGALLVEIYKENIEAQLRTANVAGFQLLDLQDYPGHGLAVIGILDSFLDSKGLISPEKFRQFNSPIVPLIRMRGFAWTSDETFSCTAEIAHYGNSNLVNRQFLWTLKYTNGTVAASGNFSPKNFQDGKLTSIGDISTSLGMITEPEQLFVEISLPGTDIINSWKIWVYPKIEIEYPDDVIISSSWNEDIQNALVDGARVLLLADEDDLEKFENTRWHPIFWSYQLFTSQPKTMGALIDKNHPALSKFPTENFSDWQWKNLLDNSTALDLEDAPTDFRPFVQFVPDFNSNKKLSAILEARVGMGRLIISTFDLKNNLENRREAKQLFHSLLAYMHSDDFLPTQSLETNILNQLLKTTAVDSSEKIHGLIFKDTFENVQGNVNINTGYSNSGRQSGIISPENYVEGDDDSQGTGGVNLIGDGKVKQIGMGAYFSPDHNFTDIGENFVIECDAKIGGTWLDLIVGSSTRTRAQWTDGHGITFQVPNRIYFYENKVQTTMPGGQTIGGVNLSDDLHIALVVGNKSFGGFDKPKISLFVNEKAMPIYCITDDSYVYRYYTREGDRSYSGNFLNFLCYNSSITTFWDNVTIKTTDAGLKIKRWLTDSDLELDSLKTYSHKINFNASDNITINGVTFSGVGESKSGANWYIRNDVGNSWRNENNTANTKITGTGTALIDNFIDTTWRTASSLELTGLNPGDVNSLKIYGIASFDAAPENHRENFLVTSSGGQFEIDENEFNEGTGIIFNIIYTVPKSGNMTIAVTPKTTSLINQFRWFAFSNEENVLSFPPKNVSASKGTFKDKIRLTWDISIAAEKYKIFRSATENTNSAAVPSGAENITSNSFDDFSIIVNDDYFYWIKSWNSNGWSDFSEVVRGFATDISAPNPPSNFSPTDGETVFLPITLEGSTYFDPASRPLAAVQFRLDGFSNFTFGATWDSGEIVTNVTKILVPESELGSKNYWQVRYKNDRNLWSQWSLPTHFYKTIPEPFLIVNFYLLFIIYYWRKL